MSQEQAFDVIIEMLIQREYDILDIDKFNMTISAIKPDGKQMSVFFNSSPKFDTKSMKDIISIMNENKIKHSLVIYTDNVTAATKSALSQSGEMRIELFAEEDLQYNITKHRLQPTFEKLSQKESETFKKEFGSKIGVLRCDKPISRFYDYEKGDVIRIIRDKYVTYRIVK